MALLPPLKLATPRISLEEDPEDAANPVVTGEHPKRFADPKSFPLEEQSVASQKHVATALENAEPLVSNVPVLAAGSTASAGVATEPPRVLPYKSFLLTSPLERNLLFK